MTKFEELLDIITRNKNKKKVQSTNNEQEDNNELEVAGSETSKNPLITFGDNDTDPDLLDQLHRSYKTKPNDGFGASSWD